MKKYHDGRIIHLSFSLKNTEAYIDDVLNFMRCSVSEDKDLEQANRLDAFFFLIIYLWLQFPSICSVILVWILFCCLPTFPTFFYLPPFLSPFSLHILLGSPQDMCTSSSVLTNQMVFILKQALQPGSGATEPGESRTLHLLSLWDPACASCGGQWNHDTGYLASQLHPLARAPAHSIL